MTVMQLAIPAISILVHFHDSPFRALGASLLGLPSNGPKISHRAIPSEKLRTISAGLRSQVMRSTLRPEKEFGSRFRIRSACCRVRTARVIANSRTSHELGGSSRRTSTIGRCRGAARGLRSALPDPLLPIPHLGTAAESDADFFAINLRISPVAGNKEMSGRRDPVAPDPRRIPWHESA